MSHLGIDAHTLAFLITVDTEGDNLWAKPRNITTQNARCLPRFQSLCERYRLRPTYLVNWEMATCPVFQEFGRNVLARRAAEIGMHLHAWNSPPLTALTQDDFLYQPYLHEYPEQLIREKVKVMTATLAETFEITPVSHRGGRWSFNETYARVLMEYQYRIDCTVTPHMSWSRMMGDPRGGGGPDFSDFPESAYLVDPSDVSRPGDSPLLEVPVTVVVPRYRKPVAATKAVLKTGGPLASRIAARFFPDHVRMTPNGRNRARLLSSLRTVRREGRDYVQLSLHSSELLQRGSPSFTTTEELERLYDDLAAIFEYAQKGYTGCTLSDYYERYIRRAPTAVAT
jgi:hypothetical protein